MDRDSESLPPSILAEAAELARGAEVLPGGVETLARRIWMAKRDGRVLRVKLGVDPTGSQLHLGHSVVLRRLQRFQSFGHQAVLIIGGFTAQIGDPSGRNSARPQLSAEEVAANARTFLDQIRGIVDLNLTEVRNNADWLASLDLTAVLQLASQATVNQLLAKEGFGERLERQQPVGLHELFYPLLQAFDSVSVHADIEIGGTDQRFNILQGRELQARMGMEPQLGLLLPILEGTDGVRKMSKTFDNAIGLTDHPHDMFAKCMRVPDGLLLKFFELATTMAGADVDAIQRELEAGANPMQVKERLATRLVMEHHGETASAEALSQWQRVHVEKLAPDTMPDHSVTEPTELRKVLVAAGLAASLNKARQHIAAGAVRLDGVKVQDIAFVVSVPPSEGVVLQVGRRQFVRLKPSQSEPL